MNLKLHVNGKATEITVDDPQMPLLYALRDELGLRGPRSDAASRNAARALSLSTVTRCARASTRSAMSVTGK